MDLSNFHIEFKKPRLVNGILLESMLFLRQNIKVYLAYLFKFCTLPILVSSYLYSQLIISHPELMGIMATGKATPELLKTLLPSLAVPFLVLFVTQIFFYSLIYGHIEQYMNQQNRPIEQGDVLKSALKRFFWLLIGFVLLIVLLVAMLVVITMLGQSTKGLSFIAFTGVIYLLVPMGLVSPILFFEKDGGFNSAFSRSMYLVRKSWLHLMIAFFMTIGIVVSISFVLNIPLQLINSSINYFLPNAEKSVIIQTVMQTIGNLCSLLAFGYIIVSSSMIYFSQVEKLDPKSHL